MKRSQILAAAGAVAALILLVLTLRQVSALREEVDGLRDRLLQMEQSLTDEISGIDNAVRRELERESSLFSASDTTLDYRDGALVLTASVLPKEVRADDALTLSAGGASTYSIKSGGITTVYVGLSPDPSGPVADRADAASLTLEVVDAPTGIPLGTVDMEPAQSPGQGGSTSSTTQAVNANALWYAADVSEYVQGEDYNLEFRAVLTTAGGLELTDPNPVVTLQPNSGSCGDVDFSPAWEE